MCTKKSVGIGVLALLLTIGFSGQAHAHKIRIFALVHVNEIRGYVYFSGGTRGKNVPVSCVNAAGDVWRTNANDHGEFTFPLVGSGPFTLHADTGDGHAATFVIREAESPGALPDETLGEPSALLPDKQNLSLLVDKAVARHIAPLRMQFNAYEEKVRLSDILGAFGYIAGIFGMFLFFKSASLKK